MDNVGGGSNRLNSFEKNRGDFVDEGENDDFWGESIRDEESDGSRGERYPRNPQLENAVGIVSVGAAGLSKETRNQGEVSRTGDNRTVEEIRIDAPEVARDGDRMEAEWMERARDVIKDTKGNPSERLTRAALLREEYMRKRFNRILGERND